MAKHKVSNANAAMVYEEVSKETFVEMKKLARKAFRDVGKAVANDIKSKINGRGYLRKGVVAKVELNKSTGNEPCLLVGYKKQSIMKDKVPFYVNPAWFEDGTSPHVIQTKEFASSGFSGYELTSQTGAKYGVKVLHPGKKGSKLLESTIKSDQSKIINAIKENLKSLEVLDIKIGDDTEIDESEEEL